MATSVIGSRREPPTMGTIFWLSAYLIKVKGCSRNTLCALNSIFTFFLNNYIHCFKRIANRSSQRIEILHIISPRVITSPFGSRCLLLCATNSAIFQLYHGDQCYWKPERTTDHGQATGKLYHLRLRVECTLFCNLQSRVRNQVYGA
jgi:hypothetical protein